MRITEMDLLFAYNWWATSRVLNAAAGLDDADFARADIVPGLFGSVRATLVHALDLERRARHRLARNASVEPLDEQSYGSVDLLARAWRTEATAMKDFLIGLENEHMDSMVVVSESERYPYWQYLLHVLNHSAQHRNEAAIVLTALDRSPGDLDFYLFLKDER